MSDMTKSDLEESIIKNDTTTTNITDTSDITDTTTDNEAVKDVERVFMDSGDISYDTLQVSKILGVQESTVRKYCALMVKHGYSFNKTSTGYRIFYKCDIEVMKEIIDLKNEGLTLEESVNKVLNAHNRDISNTTELSIQYNQLLKEFEFFRQEQSNFNQQLIKKIEEQEKYIQKQSDFNQQLMKTIEDQTNHIKKSIEERDRRLIQSIRQTMELKQKKKKKSIFNFWK